MKSKIIWLVLALALMVFASGCTSSGEEVEQVPPVEPSTATPAPAATPVPAPTPAPAPAPAKETLYTQQVGTTNGLVTLSSPARIEPVSRGDERTVDELSYLTWYVMDSSVELPDSYSASIKMVEPKDFEKVDISFELADGDVTRVHDLKVYEANGKWILEGDFKGIFGIGVWDGTEANDPHVYIEPIQSVALPDFVEQQDFFFMIYADTR